MTPDASDALVVRQKVQDFLNAARTGNLDFFKKMAKKLDDGKGLAKTVEDVKDANDRGALHFAAREGQTEMCKYLLEELKVDVNVKDADGETPLVHAARQGKTATAMYLLERGADPSIPSNFGATALRHAAGIGQIDLLKVLLSKAVNIDSESDALIWAASHMQKDAVKLLLEHNANPNAEPEDGLTPLVVAVAFGSVDCLELLIKAGANANITAGGVIPLRIAANVGNADIINCLLNAGADPNVIIDEYGHKPLQVAAERGNRQAVEILFPVTSPIQSVPRWSVDGIIEHMQAETARKQELAKKLEEVTPEAKAKAAEAKSRGDDAFERKDFQSAVDAYTQKFNKGNPSSGSESSKRSRSKVEGENAQTDTPISMFNEHPIEHSMGIKAVKKRGKQVGSTSHEQNAEYLKQKKKEEAEKIRLYHEANMANIGIKAKKLEVTTMQMKYDMLRYLMAQPNLPPEGEDFKRNLMKELSRGG